jgi:hypothetical protein
MKKLNPKRIARLIKAMKKIFSSTRRIIIYKTEDGRYYLHQHQEKSIIPELDAMDEESG